MKEIRLTKNKITIVDDMDYEKLNKYKWHTLSKKYTFYAVRKPKSGVILMHREIMGLINKDNLQVDHKDGNGLNNQRSNLRICNNGQNQMNKGKQSNNTSGYKGVNYKKEKNKWQANIEFKGKLSFLGYFATKEEAAKVYDKKARELFDEFAKTNF